MRSDSPYAADDAEPQRRRLDEILMLISQNRLDPDAAARLLLGLDHSPALLGLDHSPALLGLDHPPAAPETVESLIRRLGPPPAEVESDWKEQMRGIAAQWHASQLRPMPQLSLADWLVDSQNRISLSPAFFSDSLSDSSPTPLPTAAVLAAGECIDGDTAGRRRRSRLRFVAGAVAATILVTLVASIGSNRFGSRTGAPVATSTPSPATDPSPAGTGSSVFSTPTGRLNSPPPEPPRPGSMPGNEPADGERQVRPAADDDFGRPATKWSLADLGFDDAASSADATDENGPAARSDLPATSPAVITGAGDVTGADAIAEDTEPGDSDRPDETADPLPGTPTPSGQPLTAVKIDLSSVESSRKWPLPNRPAALVSPELGLEIRSPDTVTATWIRPPEPADARKQLSLIQWTLPGESSPALRCQIECRTTTRLQMRLRYAIRLDPQLPWQSVSQPQLAIALDQATTSLNRLLVDQSQWTKLYRAASTAEKRRLKPIKDELDLSVSRLQEILPSLQKLSGILTIINGHATIHFKLTDESIDDRPAPPDTPPVRRVILQTVDAD